MLKWTHKKINNMMQEGIIVLRCTRLTGMRSDVELKRHDFEGVNSKVVGGNMNFDLRRYNDWMSRLLQKNITF